VAVTLFRSARLANQRANLSGPKYATTTARARNDRQHDDHRHAGHRATDKRARVIDEGRAFKRGAPSTSKQAGQIPASYKQGTGTILSGATANKATKAALAAYPGGIVDRVVKLSNGEYEVHNIGVNWPHHIFVNQDFKVLGAD
jgi:hypothetical protein